MIYPIVDKIEWGLLHKLPLLSRECPNCGVQFELNTPIAIKNYRGFIMERHDCEETFYPRIYIPVEKIIIEKWETFASEITATN